MSYAGDRAEHEQTIENQNETIIRLLKALLLGIEIMTDQEDLLDNIED